MVEWVMRAIALLVALLGSALAGLVAVRTTEVQPSVLVIAVVCMTLGFAVPRLAWLWSAIVGLGVFAAYAAAAAIHYPVKAPPEPNVYGSLIALLPAFITAYIGAAARWIANPGITRAKI